ncbi:hypothetical protein LWI29_033038 [Acer saccharum]|uniref:Bulb-type lectin domain-containing protein n=1 Tax=Acer saccharum TaxID=4024 RepID=A0AA39VH31_ACESA|nr:hypothetical protein LWI29_033038 [Acer saccharum]
MASMKSVYVCGLLIIISTLFGPLNAADIITKTQFISDDINEALLSSDGRFKLGFFSPGNSVRHVGIWYRFLEKQVVWVANREIPVKNNSTGILKIAKDGNLAVFNGTAKNDPLWSTNISMETTNSSAKLLPSGNLVLVIKNESANNRETIIWQSFDYPTDTILPEM